LTIAKLGSDCTFRHCKCRYSSVSDLIAVEWMTSVRFAERTVTFLFELNHFEKPMGPASKPWLERAVSRCWRYWKLLFSAHTKLHAKPNPDSDLSYIILFYSKIPKSSCFIKFTLLLNFTNFAINIIHNVASAFTIKSTILSLSLSLSLCLCVEREWKRHIGYS